MQKFSSKEFNVEAYPFYNRYQMAALRLMVLGLLSLFFTKALKKCHFILFYKQKNPCRMYKNLAAA